jgi:ribose/xylose/arabinose/galactoside ABC-type transport system permease subunit
MSQGKPTVDALAIASCLPVVVISAVVLIIAGNVDLSFLIPAIVCGAMIGMLMFVSIRDRTST